MKAWMGGRRRKINAARRDLMIQQRQYFARLRQENQQNARSAQVRQAINSFRWPERVLLDNNSHRRLLEEPRPMGDDCLVLANPSANDSIIENLRNPKRPRLEEPRRERCQRVGNAHREPLQDLNREVSNDIRVFDDNADKTHRFRRRILPDDFLNSEVTAKDRQRGRQEAAHARHTLLGTQDWQVQDQVKKSTSLVDKKRESLRTPVCMDLVIDIQEPLRSTAAPPLSVYRNTAGSSERQYQQISSSQLRSQFSSPLNDDRTIARRPRDDDIVEATPPDDEGRTVYKDFLLGTLPSVRNEATTRIPTAQKLLSRLAALSPHFPPIKIDTDSPESRVHDRPTKSPDKGQFRSLLCHEDIISGQFSAEVQALEAKLLNLPDRDVPFLSVSKVLAEQKETRSNVLRNAMSADEECNEPHESVINPFAPSSVTDIMHTKPKRPMGGLRRQKFPPALDMDEEKTDSQYEKESEFNPESRDGDSRGMEVGLGCDVRNPVTVAADRGISEMTAKDGR